MPIIITEFEQRSEQWFKAIAGNPGASNFNKIVTTKGEKSQQQKDYLIQLAGEYLKGDVERIPVSRAMQQGIEEEPKARNVFELMQDVEVQQVGLVYKDEEKKYHASPDGIWGDDDGLEIKCPGIKVHTKYLLEKKLPTEHYIQVMGNLYITERERWWFMSYHRGLPELIIKVKRDEKFISRLQTELDKFCDQLAIMIQKLKEM